MNQNSNGNLHHQYSHLPPPSPSQPQSSSSIPNNGNLETFNFRRLGTKIKSSNRQDIKPRFEPEKEGSNNTDFRRPSSPEKVGPGVWYVLHTLALSSVNLDEMKIFVSTVRIILENFPCLKCRTNALNFWKQDPPDQSKYFDLKDEDNQSIGMFYWTWKLHNTANTHTNKPIIDFKTARNIWKLGQENYCTFDC